MHRLSRGLYLTLGLGFVLLGLVGALLPLLPTTVFLLAAAYCFGRSSRRLERWLVTHKRFGPPIVAWRDERAIGRSAKITACTGMLFGFFFFWVTAQPRTEMLLGAAILLGASALFVVTRPEPGQ